MSFYQWRPYVPVAERRRKAEREKTIRRVKDALAEIDAIGNLVPDGAALLLEHVGAQTIQTQARFRLFRAMTAHAVLL